VCEDAGPGAFDGYVQLPASFTVQGDTAVSRVHHFFADGVLARFPAVAAALPALTPEARLTFVTGVLPPDVSTEDDVAARSALVRILGQAAQADAANGSARLLAGIGRHAQGDRPHGARPQYGPPVVHHGVGGVLHRVADGAARHDVGGDVSQEEPPAPRTTGRSRRPAPGGC
jgi:hypothetical protein